MQVRVKCFATLGDHTPPGGVVDLPEGATISLLLPCLNLDPADIKLVFVNSRNSGLDTVLAEDDQVGIFPVVGGG